MSSALCLGCFGRVSRAHNIIEVNDEFESRFSRKRFKESQVINSSIKSIERLNKNTGKSKNRDQSISNIPDRFTTTSEKW